MRRIVPFVGVGNHRVAGAARELGAVLVAGDGRPPILLRKDPAGPVLDAVIRRIAARFFAGHAAPVDVEPAGPVVLHTPAADGCSSGSAERNAVEVLDQQRQGGPRRVRMLEQQRGRQGNGEKPKNTAAGNACER